MSKTETVEERRARWRRGFDKIGRQVVRDTVTGKGFPQSSQDGEAGAWLHDKEIEDDKRTSKAERRARTMHYISLAILVVIILGLKVAAFGML